MKAGVSRSLQSMARWPVVPGLLLAIGISIMAVLWEQAEVMVTGRAWLEALVLAIIIGSVFRTMCALPGHYNHGVNFAAKTLLEIAVALMGASISFGAVLKAGPLLVVGIVVIVPVAILVSVMLGLLLGLPRKMALLVACGNAICGNTAIATIAPVIDADSDDVAAAIAFTAVLSVVVVLLLPVLVFIFGLNPQAGGILAGTTVYAVPQVIAAAGSMGLLAVQTGTLVKLVRVLMLGPVTVVLSLLTARKERATDPHDRRAVRTVFLPWFISAFLGLATVNSLGLLPGIINQAAGAIASVLTIIAMAGLGLGVDLRKISAAGPRLTAVVVLSLMLLICAALLLLRFMRLF